jgi:hypothetical protein
VPLDQIPLEPAILALGNLHAAWFSKGRRIELESAAEGPVAVRDDRGALLGIGEVASGILKPRMVLPPAGRVDGPDGAVIPSGRSSS